MEIFIDIGNSAVKFLAEDQGQSWLIFFDSNNLPLPKKVWDSFPKVIQTAKVHVMWICSVKSSLDSVFRMIGEQYFGISPRFVDHQIITNLVFKIDDVKQVGHDLLALACFGVSQAPKTLIVNMGSATTITFINKRCFEGVIIAPGLGLTFAAISQKWNWLENILTTNRKILPSLEVGKNTSDALLVGLLQGHVKMIEGLISSWLAKGYQAILSGGYASQVASLFKVKISYVDQATLLGLKAIAKLNTKS